jgi:hypothetical protein
MPGRTAAILAFLVISAVVSGCAGDAPANHTTVRDSAGITIVDHGSIDLDHVPQWSISESPLVTIGTVEGSPEYQFHRVQDAIILSNGGIAVIDNSRTLRRYDPEGRHLWTAGGDGDGPGQFRYPFMVREIPGDSLLVWDGASNRLNILAADGRFVRDATASDLQGPTLPRGMAGPRMILIESRRMERTTINGHAALRHPADYYLVNLDGEVVKELGRKLFAINYQEVDEGGAFSPPIFAVSAVIAPSPDGLWYGTTEDFELSEVTDVDRTRRIVRWRGPDRTITDADVQAILAKWSEEATPDVQRFLVEYGRTHPRAEEFPAYENLEVDQAGNLWVQDFVKVHADDGQRHWTIFSADGSHVVARLVHDASVQLHDFGTNLVLGVHRDDLDVETIVLHEIVPHQTTGR